MFYSECLKPDCPTVASSSNASYIDGQSSPVKIDLDYLHKQQMIISNAVDCATDCMNDDNLSTSTPKAGSVNQLATPAFSASDSSNGPISQLKVLKSSNQINIDNRTARISMNQSSLNYFGTAGKTLSGPEKSSIQNLRTIKLTPIERADKQIIHIKPPVFQGHKSKAVKVLLNPSSSSSVSRFSVCSAEKKPKEKENDQKPAKLFKVKLTGQSNLIQPLTLGSQKNFVKLDVNNLSTADGHVKSSTAFKRLPKSKPLIRHNSSVVTNLVTRLEQQAPRSSDDSVLFKRRTIDDESNQVPLRLFKVKAKVNGFQRAQACRVIVIFCALSHYLFT